jgi:hypothetical protein
VGWAKPAVDRQPVWHSVDVHTLKACSGASCRHFQEWCHNCHEAWGDTSYLDVRKQHTKSVLDLIAGRGRAPLAPTGPIEVLCSLLKHTRSCSLKWASLVMCLLIRKNGLPWCAGAERRVHQVTADLLWVTAQLTPSISCRRAWLLQQMQQRSFLTTRSWPSATMC